LIAFCKSER